MSSESSNNNSTSTISLAIALAQNFARDWTWGIWSVEDWNFKFESTRYDLGPNGQWGPQFLYGSLAAISATLISAGICKASGKQIPVKDMMASLVGTMAAIIPWNAGQNLGILIGNALGWPQVNSAFFASTFTGIFEGATQFIMIKITSKLCDAEERRKFCEDPKQYLTDLFDKETLKQFSKEFGYSISIGAIPGAIWQLVFTACGVAGISAVPTGLLIALAVGLANFGVAKVQEKLFAPQTYFFLPTRTAPVEIDLAPAQLTLI
ncbi:MAG: hypothetical protein SFW07_07205 [Gammaproteobacteria bacterium]|nr:hypothetical protein [Gammaproteobacteria bacterium]